jgi:[NiFe] hydrogenase assembly HybE family chaperone
VSDCLWHKNPSSAIEHIFREIAQTRMKDMPLSHPNLSVEAVDFRRYAKSQEQPPHWRGILILPWTMNLLLLPTPESVNVWPNSPLGHAFLWHFPFGVYSCTSAHTEKLGAYHFCPLFSPPLPFASQEEARNTARAALITLETQVAQTGPRHTAPENIAAENTLMRRRDFLNPARFFGKRAKGGFNA